MPPAVVGLAYLAECLCLLGFPDLACRRMKDARDLAKQVQLPMAFCYSQGRSCWLAALLGDLGPVRGHPLVKVNQAARVGHGYLGDGTKIRVCKNCGEQIEK